MRLQQLGTYKGRKSLELHVLRLGLLQDGDVGVGVFPELEEILVGGAAIAVVARQGVGAPVKSVKVYCGNPNLRINSA